MINICPKCGSHLIKIHGLTKSGTIRYKCTECFKTFTGTKLGRPTLGDRAMTNRERQQKHRDKKNQVIKT